MGGIIKNNFIVLKALTRVESDRRRLVSFAHLFLVSKAERTKASISQSPLNSLIHTNLLIKTRGIQLLLVSIVYVKNKSYQGTGWIKNNGPFISSNLLHWTELF